MEWERNAAQEIKEKGEGDIESYHKLRRYKEAIGSGESNEKQLVAVEPLQVVSFVVPHNE